MAQSKIKTLKEISRLVVKHKKENKTVSLITGCFDILHLGHIELFRFAKKHSDYLIVGLDNDKSINLSKGQDRPINKFLARSQFLSELKSVDYVFEIKEVVKFGLPEAGEAQAKIFNIIKPNFIVTNITADKYWKKKEVLLKHMPIKFLKDKGNKFISSSSTSLIESLLVKHGL